MVVDLETRTISRRSHIRASHLINGGVYKPRRYKRTGRHRAPGTAARVNAWLRRILGGDAFTITGFYVILAAAAVCSAAGLLLDLIGGWYRYAVAMSVAGTIFFVFAGAIIGFCYIDPLPDQ